MKRLPRQQLLLIAVSVAAVTALRLVYGLFHAEGILFAFVTAVFASQFGPRAAAVAAVLGLVAIYIQLLVQNPGWLYAPWRLMNPELATGLGIYFLLSAAIVYVSYRHYGVLKHLGHERQEKERIDALYKLELERSLSRERASRQEAEGANRLKDEFLATLSHELRTPLNAILGYARMLRSGVLDQSRQARGLEVLERNAIALSRIIEDILDVSRIISGKTRLNVQPVELSAIVDQSVATLQLAAEAKSLAMTVRAEESNLIVSGDADRLQQVIWNLLANAVKFTAPGGRIDIRLTRTGSFAEIAVSDSGIGIAPEFVAHVFDRFRQADSRSTRRHGGLGLGLAICRHLVELHGGTIHAHSDGEGKGATFCVNVPLLASPAHLEEHGFAQMPGGPLSPSLRLNGLHVFAVDDQQDVLVLLREILEHSGARVTTLGSTGEMMDALQKTVPDALIADIGMPESDGFDLIKRVRGSSNQTIRHLPAAALTAYARADDRSNILNAGFQMHLRKPIDPDQLVAAVISLLEGSAAAAN
jgi:signal transduction histidine kinase/ActR/RegA family two-component response regulator